MALKEEADAEAVKTAYRRASELLNEPFDEKEMFLDHVRRM